MNPTAVTTETDYKQLFSQLIKKQMLVLGPDITLAKVKNVTGITVNPTGDVVSIEGDPQVLLQNLINQFVELSGMIVKKTMESILTSYPGMMAMAATGALGGMPQQSDSFPQPPQAQGSIDVKSDANVISPQVTQTAQVQPQTPLNSPLEADKKPPEPPSMVDMKLDSLTAVGSGRPDEESFTEDDMQKLNKALDELSNMPVPQDQKSVN